MRSKIAAKWRDIISVLTIFLVMGSLIMIAYGVSQANKLATQQRQQINCIASFFSQTDRQNKAISNTRDCDITRIK